MSASAWQLEGDTAQLTVGGFCATVRLSAPDEGMGRLSIDGQSHPGAVQQVLFSDPAGVLRGALQDAYVRGDDLIATYGLTERLVFRPQVYWRAVRPRRDRPGSATVDTIVSVETSLLDSRPCVHVATSLPAERLCLLGGTELAVGRRDVPLPTELAGADQPGCILIRLPGGGPSYAVLVHPDDYRMATVTRTADDRVRTAHRFFADPLEKGVILRARLRVALVPRQGDLAAAAAWYGALVGEALPLTT